MRHLPEAETSLYVPDNCINKQDNFQRSQQANSQNITLHMPKESTCKGNNLVINISSRNGEPITPQKIQLLWGGSEVAETLSNSGQAIFQALPCGFYCLKIGDIAIDKIKLIGNQDKEFYVVI